MNNYRRNTLIILVIFLLIVSGLGFINYQDMNIPYLNWLEKGIYDITTPVLDYYNRARDTINSLWTGFFQRREMVAENKRLEKRVAELERENNLLERFEKENSRLRELLAFRKYVHYKILGAEVIGVGPSNWENKIIIDRGSNDGIKKKMPVITYNGSLVGRIDYVGANSAQVRLVYDPEFVVGGIVQREESRAIGLVRGQLNNKDFNIMDKISWDADIKKDDLILTSGLSNNYPKGLPIGKVNEVKTDNYGLSLKAEVKLFARLNTIEEVLIITDY